MYQKYWVDLTEAERYQLKQFVSSGVVCNNRLGRLKFLYIPFFYCLANAAALVAVFKLLSCTRVEQWQPQR